MATYHFFFPFTLPYIVCREGVVAAANMQLLFVHNFGTMFNSYLVQFGVWTLCFLQFTSIHADGRIHLLFSLAMIAYASRVGVIALKYALLGPVRLFCCCCFVVVVLCSFHPLPVPLWCNVTC